MANNNTILNVETSPLYIYSKSSYTQWRYKVRHNMRFGMFYQRDQSHTMHTYCTSHLFIFILYHQQLLVVLFETQICVSATFFQNWSSYSLANGIGNGLHAGAHRACAPRDKFTRQSSLLSGILTLSCIIALLAGLLDKQYSCMKG